MKCSIEMKLDNCCGDRLALHQRLVLIRLLISNHMTVMKGSLIRFSCRFLSRTIPNATRNAYNNLGRVGGCELNVVGVAWTSNILSDITVTDGL